MVRRTYEVKEDLRTRLIKNVNKYGSSDLIIVVFCLLGITVVMIAFC